MAAHQAAPSLGFSRQEHWSGLPFPSPMQESEKWKWSRSIVSHPQRPHGLQPTRLLHPWDFPGKSTGVGCHCLLRRAVYLGIFYSRRVITFHCLIYFQMSHFFPVVVIIPQILWNSRLLINADQMSYSTLYWVGQKVHLSFSLWCLVREQEVFPEYILIKNNISKEVENRTLILVCGTQINIVVHMLL